MSDLTAMDSHDSSRRDLLKKGLVAGGIVWTAPVVTTLNTPLAAATGSSGGSYTYCFDDGTTEGWTIDNTAGAGGGLWNVSNDRSVSASFSLHYGTGTGGDYTGGGRNSGSVTSPTFTVPTSGPVLLEFDIWREVEVFGSGTWDEFSVSILPAGTTLYAVSRDGGTGGVFEHVTIDLAGFAGQTVQLSFFFDTGDGSFNNFEGIYVDNVIVPGATGGFGLLAGGGTSAAARSLGGEGWTPARPEPTRQELRRREREVRAQRFAEGAADDGELQAGIKTGQ